jgi:phosphate acetyltransferase
MDIIDEFKQRAKANPKRIVLPEPEDERVLRAAAIVGAEGTAKPILIGNEGVVRDHAARFGLDLERVQIVEPSSSPKLPEYVEMYCTRKSSSEKLAQAVLRKAMNFGFMMTVTGDADATVAGASHTSGEIIATANLVLGLSSGISLPSSFLLIAIPGCKYGENGVFIFSDASVNPEPQPEGLADIAAASALSARTMLGWTPRVAMLSFSTKGSASHSMVEKVVKATAIAREKFPDLVIDGELQADAALVPDVAGRKVPGGSAVAGKANVLIFPDLNASNIAYKLVERLAGAHAYGPILQGFSRPVSDLSRGATVEDIVGTITLLAVQAQRWKRE